MKRVLGTEAGIQSRKMIHKETVPIDGEFKLVSLPRTAAVLSCGQVKHQGYEYAMSFWYEFDTDDLVDEYRPYAFKAFGTGTEIPAGWHYLDTAEDGNFVWHLYFSYAEESK